MFSIKWHEHKLVRFGLVGLLATIIDFGVLNLFLILHTSLILAASTGYLMGFFTSYILNGYWTFKEKKNWRNLGKFIVVNIFSLIFTNVIVVGIASFGVNPNEAKIVAVFVIFFWNYLMNKYWVFAPTGVTNQPAKQYS